MILIAGSILEPLFQLLFSTVASLHTDYYV